MKKKLFSKRNVAVIITVIIAVIVSVIEKPEAFNTYESTGTNAVSQIVNEVVAKTSDTDITSNTNSYTEVILDEYVEEVNGNVPKFDATDLALGTMEFEEYSELDDLGRCGVAFANISSVTIPTEERGEIGSVKPTGWHTVKYPGVVDGNYLYNRCHLIAYCLAGENANKQNLITGTRYLNNELMLPYELKVVKYMDANPDNHVLYRVTPYFEGNNLIASYVQMEAYSIEDNGTGVCFNVICYNVQPGILIDYATGESKLE